MFLISGWINRPRVKDWPDMWCFPGQGCGSNVSMARSQDQSPLVPVLSSLTPPSAPLLSLLHSQNWPRRRIVLRSPSHALIPSLVPSAVMMVVSDDLPCADVVAPGDLISAWCWLIHKMLAGWRRAQARATRYYKRWAADSGPPPVTTTTTRQPKDEWNSHPLFIMQTFVLDNIPQLLEIVEISFQTFHP